MVESMFHLRRVQFRNYVCEKNNGGGAVGGKKAGSNDKDAINDNMEPTKNPTLRAKSTYILLDRVTKIGRNPELVDVVLNSVWHSNMISRNHSEIFGELDENQQFKYCICDKSLNGTYVNDHRVNGAVTLKEGDVIKFGHVNGAAIKAGEYAPQQIAEFVFRFERAIPGHVYFGYTKERGRQHPEKTRAYMQIYSDRVVPQEAFPATTPGAAVIGAKAILPQPTIAAANATVAAPTAVPLPPSISGPLPQPTAQFPATTQTHSVTSTAACTVPPTNAILAQPQAPIAVGGQSASAVTQSTLAAASAALGSGAALALQPQHAAAAAALAASANLSPDDMAAVSAHFRTVAAADALNSWNSSLLQLSRLQQQNPHLYGSAFPAAAAAAAAYFQSNNPALWSNVAQWRAALQPNTPATPDWMQLTNQAAQQKALASYSASSLQQQLRLPPYSGQSAALGNAAGLPAPLPIPGTGLPSSAASLLMTAPQQASCSTLCNTSTGANPLYTYSSVLSAAAPGGVIASTSATGPSLLGSSAMLCSTTSSPSAAYSSCTSAAAGGQNGGAGRLPSKEEIDLATRAAAAWPAIASSSASSSSGQPQGFTPSLASVLPSALRQVGVPLSYMANSSGLSIGQRIPIATALAAVSGTINGPATANQTAKPATSQPSTSVDPNSAPRALGSPLVVGTPPLSVKIERGTSNGRPTSLTSNNSGSNLLGSPTLARNDADVFNLTETKPSTSTLNADPEPETQGTSINSLAAAIFDPATRLDKLGRRSSGSNASVTPALTKSPKKALKRTKTAELGALVTAAIDTRPSTSVLNGSGSSSSRSSIATDLRQLNITTPALETPKADAVKTMECDSSVPSPPKVDNGNMNLIVNNNVNGHHGDNSVMHSPVLSNPSRPCSYQSSIPLSPPRAPCPAVRRSPGASESESHSPNPEAQKYCSSNAADSPTSWSKRQEDELVRREKKKKKKEREDKEVDDDDRKGPKPLKQPRKSNEVARLLNDLTAGNCKKLKHKHHKKKHKSKDKDKDKERSKDKEKDGSSNKKEKLSKKKMLKMMRRLKEQERLENLGCEVDTSLPGSWMHQAERSQRGNSTTNSTGASKSGADGGTLPSGIKDGTEKDGEVKKKRALRLEERKLRAMAKRKQHKMMRQISDESSDDSDAEGKSAGAQEKTAPNQTKRSANSSDEAGSDSEATSAKPRRNNLLSSAPTPKTNAKSKALNPELNKTMSTPNGISAADPTPGDTPSGPFKAVVVKQRLTSLDSSVLKSVMGSPGGTPGKTKISTQEKRRMLKEKEERESKSKAALQKQKASVTKKADKSQRISKRKSGSSGRKGSDESDDSDSDVSIGGTKPPPPKRSSNGSANKTPSTTSSAAKRKSGGRVSFAVGTKDTKKNDAGDHNDAWFLYHDPDRDLCAHKQCQRPQQMSINWVQCDDCDGWYHSLCALGSNTELEDDADFHCGCLASKNKK